MWLPTLEASHGLLLAIVAIFWRRGLAVVSLLHLRGLTRPAMLLSRAHLSYSSLTSSSCITFTVSPEFNRTVPAGTTISASAVPKPASG